MLWFANETRSPACLPENQTLTKHSFVSTVFDSGTEKHQRQHLTQHLLKKASISLLSSSRGVTLCARAENISHPFKTLSISLSRSTSDNSSWPHWLWFSEKPTKKFKRCPNILLAPLTKARCTRPITCVWKISRLIPALSLTRPLKKVKCAAIRRRIPSSCVGVLSVLAALLHISHCSTNLTKLYRQCAETSHDNWGVKVRFARTSRCSSIPASLLQ